MIFGKIQEFDTSDWAVSSSAPEKIVWANDRIGVMSASFVSGAPQYEPSLKELQDGFRAAAKSSDGGLISVDVLDLKGIPCIKAIVKAQSWSTTVMYYTGFLIFLFPDCQILVHVQSNENDTTGLRSAFVFERLVGIGQVKLDEQTNQPLNWSADPYDATITGPGLRNRSEDETYDRRFPEDPLTKVRDTLRKIEKSIAFGPDVQPLKIQFR